ncbi:MAG: hypothetical protein AB1351_00105 [Thermoproteota archaeon]
MKRRGAVGREKAGTFPGEAHLHLHPDGCIWFNVPGGYAEHGTFAQPALEEEEYYYHIIIPAGL